MLTFGVSRVGCGVGFGGLDCIFLAKSRRGAARLLWRASVCLNVDLLAGVLVCFVRVCFGCSVL